VLPNGNIMLFDNGNAQSPFKPAAAKEYKLDEKNKTCTLVWSYINDSTAQSSVGMGNVQRLANGNTLIDYGNSNRSRTLFNVVTPQGKKIFELYFKDNSRSYRAQNYSGISFDIKRPAIKTFKKDGVIYLDAGEHPEYLWSNGAKTRIISYKDEEILFVCVPVQDGGYIVSSPCRFSDYKKK
jgi:hypothetical protein